MATSVDKLRTVDAKKLKELFYKLRSLTTSNYFIHPGEVIQPSVTINPG